MYTYIHICIVTLCWVLGRAPTHHFRRDIVQQLERPTGFKLSPND